MDEIAEVDSARGFLDRHQGAGAWLQVSIVRKPPCAEPYAIDWQLA